MLQGRKQHAFVCIAFPAMEHTSAAEFAPKSILSTGRPIMIIFSLGTSMRLAFTEKNAPDLSDSHGQRSKAQSNVEAN